MDEFVIYHVPREENPRANALAQQASGYNVRKRNFQEHKPLLTTECFALETLVRPMQSPGLTGDTGLTGATNRSDWSHDKSSSSVFVPKMRWRIGGSLWLIICIILAVQLTEQSDDGLLSLFLMMVSGILPGYHTRKDEDGLLLEFPCNSTRTRSV
jgi:hypothetical protein